MGSDQLPYYTHPDGRHFPRVTSILDIIRSPELEAWRERLGVAEASRVSGLATKIGTAVHEAIHAHLAGRKGPKLTGDRLRAFEAWLDWYKAQQDFKPTRLETTLFSDLGFAGTPDCLEDGVFNGGVCRVTDWKTSARIDDKHWVQAHAYAAMAWPQSTEPEKIRLRIVRIDPFLGLVEVRERAFDPAILDTFVALTKVYRDWFMRPIETQPEGDNSDV